MAVNSYLTIDGRPGPSASKQDAIDVLSFGASQTTAAPPATVQVGEQNLGQVAARLGVDPSLLQQANPHITDPSKLQVGQEIQVPTNPEPHSEQGNETEAAGPHHHHHEMSNPPLGSSIEASLMKAKLDGMTAKKRDD
jgi:LysM repeat protein